MYKGIVCGWCGLLGGLCVNCVWLLCELLLNWKWLEVNVFFVVNFLDGLDWRARWGLPPVGGGFNKGWEYPRIIFLCVAVCGSVADSF